jgi:hypothetical protein
MAVGLYIYGIWSSGFWGCEKTSLFPKGVPAMSLADELQKLEQLRSSGSLTEAEFELAKKRILSAPSEDRHFNSDETGKPNVLMDMRDDRDESLGRAANRYVSFHIVSGILGLLVFLILLFAVFLPRFNNSSQFPGGFQHIEWKKAP